MSETINREADEAGSRGDRDCRIGNLEGEESWKVLDDRKTKWPTSERVAAAAHCRRLAAGVPMS